VFELDALFNCVGPFGSLDEPTPRAPTNRSDARNKVLFPTPRLRPVSNKSDYCPRYSGLPFLPDLPSYLFLSRKSKGRNLAPHRAGSPLLWSYMRGTVSPSSIHSSLQSILLGRFCPQMELSRPRCRMWMPSQAMKLGDGVPYLPSHRVLQRLRTFQPPEWSDSARSLYLSWPPDFRGQLRALKRWRLRSLGRHRCPSA